jgi:hypothetical protein
MKTLDTNAAANRLTDLDPQLQRYVAAALPLMQLQTLQTIAAHKDPANFPAKPRQIRVQNSTKPYDNIGLAVDKWLEALPAEKRAKLLADSTLISSRLNSERRCTGKVIEIAQARLGASGPDLLVQLR